MSHMIQLCIVLKDNSNLHQLHGNQDAKAVAALHLFDYSLLFAPPPSFQPDPTVPKHRFVSRVEWTHKGVGSKVFYSAAFLHHHFTFCSPWFSLPDNGL